jgi:hypothetical protein
MPRVVSLAARRRLRLERHDGENEGDEREAGKAQRPAFQPLRRLRLRRRAPAFGVGQPLRSLRAGPEYLEDPFLSLFLMSSVFFVVVASSVEAIPTRGLYNGPPWTS